jgi:DNA processing protein
VNDQKLFWVGFNRIRGIGAVRFQALLNYFGDLQTAWEAPRGALREAGLSAKLADTVLTERTKTDLQGYLDQIRKNGIRVITWIDDDYPTRLREIQASPPVLYVRGTITTRDDWSAAIVGTRRMTSYGRQITKELAGILALSGLTIVSGLARGVDSVAHRTALAEGGRTLAVLGSGVDTIYPPEHRGLAEAIVENGALISDYSPGTPPESTNFPPRNRIISGLSLATVVIEAGQSSGALITASFAVDQGRDVFAVPGNITAPQSKGTNRLISKGAFPLLDPTDVLDSLNLTMIASYQQMRDNVPGDETEAKLLAVIQSEPVHVDEISAITSLPVEKVTATLVIMELKGMVRRVGGMQYVAS